MHTLSGSVPCMLLALSTLGPAVASAASYEMRQVMSGLAVQSTAPAPASASAAVSADSLVFDSTFVGQNQEKSVLLLNTGSSPMTLSAPAVSGEAFTATTQCGSSLPGGAACQTTVTFSPSVPGAATGALSFAFGAAGSPLNVALSGTGALATPMLGAFSLPSKSIGDLPFVLTPPASNSAGTWSYSSSNPAVASVSGNVLTLNAVGAAVITATQAATATYASTSATATLNVSGNAMMGDCLSGAATGCDTVSSGLVGTYVNNPDKYPAAGCKTSGKWYVELNPNASSAGQEEVGMAVMGPRAIMVHDLPWSWGFTAQSYPLWYYHTLNGTSTVDGGSTGIPRVSGANWVGLAIDLDASTVDVFYKNAKIKTIALAAGKCYVPIVSGQYTNTRDALGMNLGSAMFQMPAPSGYHGGWY